jgi:hypothetical protein
MATKTQTQSVVSDLEYDWLTVMQNKAKALMAYDQYIEDARKAKSEPCVEFFQKLKESESKQIDEIREHLKMVMPD